MNIIIFGAGALGSEISIELARRAKALEFPLALHIIDYDDVEERNTFSQAFVPEDIGNMKVDSVARITSQFVETAVYPTKIETHKDFPEVENAIMINCVDNIPARQQAWLWALGTSSPLIHAGLSPDGHGVVNWTTPEHDDFMYPLGQEYPETEEIKLPPCELASLRSLIRGTASAVVESLMIYLGIDSLELISKKWDIGELGGSTKLVCLNWTTTIFSQTPDVENITLNVKELTAEEQAEQLVKAEIEAALATAN
jgi:hypothetical protein